MNNKEGCLHLRHPSVFADFLLSFSFSLLAVSEIFFASLVKADFIACTALTVTFLIPVAVFIAISFTFAPNAAKNLQIDFPSDFMPGAIFVQSSLTFAAVSLANFAIAVLSRMKKGFIFFANDIAKRQIASAIGRSTGYILSQSISKKPEIRSRIVLTASPIFPRAPFILSKNARTFSFLIFSVRVEIVTSFFTVRRSTILSRR